jgi:hypothetical protein
MKNNMIGHVNDLLLVRLKGEYRESKASSLLFLVDTDFSQNIFF